MKVWNFNPKEYSSLNIISFVFSTAKHCVLSVAHGWLTMSQLWDLSAHPNTYVILCGATSYIQDAEQWLEVFDRGFEWIP